MFEAWDELGGEPEQDGEQEAGSFEDSDRFEEDSLCSYLSETESSCNNWRGWKKCPSGAAQGTSPQPLRNVPSAGNDCEVSSLLELSARQVAKHFPFELVEKRIHPSPVAEHLQKRIAFWSFPESDEDIRLYSCLANGNAEEFQKGEHLFRAKLVRDLLQIGFHLSASVAPPQNNICNGNSAFNVAVTFDRHRITSCSCTCRHPTTTAWCAHVVAVCLQRIHQPTSATLRASLSESIERLDLVQLRKFAQYFISELPRQVLPTAQGLLDQLLCSSSEMNKTHGAPDPTAGPSLSDVTCWSLDQEALHESIRNLLVKFCIPTPLVCSDVNYLSTCAPPAATEWTNLLRPLRGREPEGMWNLLSIIREMFRRHDNNAVPLLTIVTDECLACDQIVVWWYSAKVSHGHGVSCGFGRMGNGPSVTGPQNASAGLMDEIATLWRLAALNPKNDDEERVFLKQLLQEYQTQCTAKVQKLKEPNAHAAGNHVDVEHYSGFKPAIEACLLDWNGYSVQGTAVDRLSPMNCAKRPGSSEPNHQQPQIQGGFFKRHSLSQPVVAPLLAQVLGHIGGDRSVEDSASSGNDSQEDESQPSTSKEFPERDVCDIFGRKMEVLFMRAEALYVHGYPTDACRLAVNLTEEMLKSLPNFSGLADPVFSGETPINHRARKKVLHHITMTATGLFSKIAFLLNVLLESPSHYHLAFQLGLMGLEMPRPPTNAKALEVKMTHQEIELVTLLKKIPLGPEEFQFIKTKARALRDGSLKSRGDALLPLTLAMFILDSLCGTANGGVRQNAFRPDENNEELGFEAAVTALGLKSNISEAEYPLLCEGIRRQRGDLACTLLVRYKDDPAKLEKIMDHLLDKEIHKMGYVTPKQMPSLAKASTSVNQVVPQHAGRNLPQVAPQPPGLALDDVKRAIDDVAAKLTEQPRSCSLRTADSEDSSALEEDNKAVQSKLRCTVFKPKRRHPEGMGGIDSSAPETTSSDNSPTMIRRFPRLKQSGPGSDSGSSGESSTDSRDSSFRRDEDGGEVGLLKPTVPVMEALARSSTPCIKGSKSRTKRSPTGPNQPSDALAHFMFELAKAILSKAGGNTSTAIFQPGVALNHPTTHRGLHMCAFQIGLYALGIQNCVHQNWQSRTYSSHVSWITGQAMELGVCAVNFLIETWERHLTPPEVALLADKASRSADLQMVHAAAELAQTALPHSHALNPNEIHRALAQCKEQSPGMLEQALRAVESSAQSGGVCPEALFDVAHKWYDMYAEAVGEVQVNNLEMQGHAVFSNNQADHLPNMGPMGFPLHMQQYPFMNRHHSPYYVTSHHGRVHHSVPHGLVNNFYHQQNLVAQNMLFHGGVPGLPMHHAVVPLQQQAHAPPMQNMLAAIPHPARPHLMSAYRVGMLGMETLARRLHDGQIAAKYSKTPPYGDFVRWLFEVSKKLGIPWMQQFCMAAVNTVSSPFILWEIAVDGAQYLSNNNPHAVGLQLTSLALQPLVQKSLQMFTSCLRQKLHHICPTDHEDFVSTASAAQLVYSSTPNGLALFQQFLTEIRRNKSCKPDLLNKLTSAFGQIPP